MQKQDKPASPRDKRLAEALKRNIARRKALQKLPGEEGEKKDK
ncbi:MAG: hypothetical protein R3C25_02435 [Hyphomonadaceae bacterium]